MKNTLFSPLRHTLRWLTPALSAALILSSCYPPQISYPYTVLVTERRATLQENLLELLPQEQRALPEAKEEAQWIADTAYKAAAGIARVNDSNFPGWAGNFLINMHLQDRGLCWHYQHDMYRELRRKPLHFFRLGCCVRDIADGSEHNCVYVAAAHEPWPKAWVLDAWMWNGRLKVDAAWELSSRRWQDLPNVTNLLAQFYPEGHQLPIEHWLSVRVSGNTYDLIVNDEGKNCDQYLDMMENIRRGKEEHPNTPTNY